MGWEIGYDSTWERWIGYGVPSVCDHQDCNEKIDRGLAHVCGGEPYGGEYGCGLYFCAKHLYISDVGNDEVKQLCKRCKDGKESFKPTPDTQEWINHILTHESWKAWRDENPNKVKDMTRRQPMHINDP